MRRGTGRAVVAAAAAMLLLVRSGEPLRGATASEYDVKAAMTFNFAKFVEWPKSSSQGPVSLCVIGDPTMAAVLTETVKEKQIQGRAVEVKGLEGAAQAPGCHVLYSGRLKPEQYGELTAAIGKHPVLTVGEGSDFTRRGGMIGFFWSDNRLNFQINVEASRAAGLTISSKLLRLATIEGARR